MFTPRQCSLFLVAGITLAAILLGQGAYGPGLYALTFAVALVGFYASVQLWRTRTFSGSLYFAWGWGMVVLEVIADAAAEPKVWAVAGGAVVLGLVLHAGRRLLRGPDSVKH
jgi:uncharacterized membrane protein